MAVNQKYDEPYIISLSKLNSFKLILSSKVRTSVQFFCTDFIIPEVATGVLWKKVFLKISQISQNCRLKGLNSICFLYTTSIYIAEYKNRNHQVRSTLCDLDLNLQKNLLKDISFLYFNNNFSFLFSVPVFVTIAFSNF